MIISRLDIGDLEFELTTYLTGESGHNVRAAGLRPRWNQYPFSSVATARRIVGLLLAFAMKTDHQVQTLLVHLD